MKNLEIIPQLEAHESYETLGVYLMADGNHKDELKELKDIAKAWADKISLSLLSANETVTAIHATIEKKLTYPLMALTIKNGDPSMTSPLDHGTCAVIRNGIGLFPIWKHLTVTINDTFSSITNNHNYLPHP